MHFRKLRLLCHVVLVSCVTSSNATYQNVALHKPNKGSTVYLTNDLNDGSTSSYCPMVYFYSYSQYYSSNSDTLWWIVDLEHHYQIPSVEVYQRDIYYYSNSFKKFYIYVSEDNPYPSMAFINGDPFQGELCVYHESSIPKSVMFSLTCSKPLTGRYVTIWAPDFYGYLALCEVRVLAGEPVLTTSAMPSDKTNLVFDVNSGKTFATPFYTRVLDRPHPIVCAMTCLSVRQTQPIGYGTVAQLDTSTGKCECVIKGSFTSPILLKYFYTTSTWRTLDLHTD